MGGWCGCSCSSSAKAKTASSSSWKGRGQINQQTGQLTITFDETPQLPFSELQADAGGR